MPAARQRWTPDHAPGRVKGETVYPTSYDASQNSNGQSASYIYTFGTTSSWALRCRPIRPTPAAAPESSAATTDVYDQNGNLVSETMPSPAGGDNTTTYQYDALGRPVQQTVNGTTYLGPTYDADGNVTSDTDLQTAKLPITPTTRGTSWCKRPTPIRNRSQPRFR